MDAAAPVGRHPDDHACRQEPRFDGHVVVGVERTPEGRAAVRWALRLAEREGRPVTLLRIWRDADWMLSARLDQIEDIARTEREDLDLLAEQAREARAAAPTVQVRGYALRGGLFPALERIGRSAATVVLGAHGDACVPGLVGSWCLDHVGCRVVVVAAAGRVVIDLPAMDSAGALA